MNNDDEKQSVAQENTGVPEGLGHDPLEWLQDDEDDMVAEVSASSENASSEPPAAEVPEQAPEPAEVDAAITAETETPAVEAEAPMVEAEVSTASESKPDASAHQSFTFDNHKAILTLPEKLTVQIIEPLHSEWKTLLYDLPQSLEVDASQVKDVDAAGMQLFYALVQQMVFKGSDVEILNVQPALKRHFDLFGLEEFFSQHIHAA